MCLVSDYGLQNPALREISIGQSRAARIFNRYTLFRIFLFVPVFALATPLLLASGSVLRDDLSFFSILAIATFFGSHGDFAQFFFRGIGKYAAEVWISVISGALYLLLVGLVDYRTHDIESVGLAILGSRLFYLLLSVTAAKRYARVFI
jgi:hypothetical protein